MLRADVAYYDVHVRLIGDPNWFKVLGPDAANPANLRQRKDDHWLEIEKDSRWCRMSAVAEMKVQERQPTEAETAEREAATAESAADSRKEMLKRLEDRTAKAPPFDVV